MKLLPALALFLITAGFTACSGSADPAQLTRDGVAALNSGKPADAFKMLDKAVQAMEPTDPKYGQAAVNRCRALAHTDAAKAKDEFLALAAAHASAVEEVDYEIVADTLRSKKKYAEAIEILAAGMQRYTESPKLIALRDQLGKEAETSGDSSALDAIKGLGYVGD
jgi:hypothetical protein